jgi:hypothetical protein
VHRDYSRNAKWWTRILAVFRELFGIFQGINNFRFIQRFLRNLGWMKKTETRAHTQTHIYIYIYIYTHTHIHAVLMFAIKLFCNTLYIIRTAVLPERIRGNIPKTLL